MKTNRYKGPCFNCGVEVVAGAGKLTGRRGHWKTWCVDCEPFVRPRGTHTGWFESPMATLDLETTGTDPHADRIISYACLGPEQTSHHVTDGPGPPDLCGLINPGVNINEKAVEIHGIGPDQLVGAPSTEEVIGDLLAWLNALIETGTGVVVFNAPYDLSMLSAEAQRYGKHQPRWENLMVIDPLILDWGVCDGDVRPRKLTDLSRFYEVELAEAHDAQADAVAARQVAIEIGSRFEDVGILELPALLTRQREWFAEKAEDWNAYARRAGRTLDNPAAWPLLC